MKKWGIKETCKEPCIIQKTGIISFSLMIILSLYLKNIKSTKSKDNRVVVTNFVD